MRKARKLELLNKINVELSRVLCTQNAELIKGWWSRSNNLFAPTPLEYIIEDPEGLKEILHHFKNIKPL